jgi:hypothetical protein
MPRYFTVDEAHHHLANVAQDVREAVALKQQYAAAKAELENSLKRIALLGGTLVDRDPILALKNRREVSGRKLKAAVERVNSYGCVVKDLDIGLLDFPTLYRGQEVYLCWKLGETRIEHWHGVSEGFQGRKKIDQEFLDNHQGDPID